MNNIGATNPSVISEQVLLARLKQSDEMREFFIGMWLQNPALAKQGGIRVRNLLSPMGAINRGDKNVE